MSSIGTLSLDNSRYAALRAAFAGKITGRGSPGAFSHARPVASMRWRARPSGSELRPYSMSSQSVSRGRQGSDVAPMEGAG